jgi:hypothetical protein
MAAGARRLPAEPELATAPRISRSSSRSGRARRRERRGPGPRCSSSSRCTSSSVSRTRWSSSSRSSSRTTSSSTTDPRSPAPATSCTVISRSTKELLLGLPVLVTGPTASTARTAGARCSLWPPCPDRRARGAGSAAPASARPRSPSVRLLLSRAPVLGELGHGRGELAGLLRSSGLIRRARDMDPGTTHRLADRLADLDRAVAARAVTGEASRDPAGDLRLSLLDLRPRDPVAWSRATRRGETLVRGVVAETPRRVPEMTNAVWAVPGWAPRTQPDGRHVRDSSALRMRPARLLSVEVVGDRVALLPRLTAPRTRARVLASDLHRSPSSSPTSAMLRHSFRDEMCHHRRMFHHHSSIGGVPCGGGGTARASRRGGRRRTGRSPGFARIGRRR